MTLLLLTFITHTLIFVDSEFYQVCAFILANILNWDTGNSWASTVVTILNGDFTRLAHSQWWTRLGCRGKVAGTAVVLAAIHKSVVGNIQLMAKWIITWRWELWTSIVDWWPARLASLAV